MSRRLPQTLAWLILAACVANAVVTLWLFGQGENLAVGALPLILAFLCFPLVGAAIVNQRPANTVGWIFLAAGVGTLVTSFSAAYVQVALNTHADARLATGLVDITGDMMWPINLGLGVALLLLFPDGRPLSRRWGILLWALLADLVIVVLAQAVTPGPLEPNNRVPNPLGIASLGALPSNVQGIGQSLLLPFIVCAIISLVVRYRREAGAQRQQIKWFVFGSTVMIIVIVCGEVAAGFISSDPNDLVANLVGNLAFAFGILALPLGVGVGVLRYKLYDIDRLINRTLLYGALTVILAALFFGLIYGGQAFINLFTRQLGDSPILIVLSTLLSVALAQPLRNWLQRAIDRRFYRSRYNAARTLEAFGSTLRSEVELRDLSDNLLAVVEETMQPAQLSLWLRVPHSGAEISMNREGGPQ